MGTIVVGLVVIGGLVLVGLLVSRAADREQRRLDRARAAAAPALATVVELAATGSAITSTGLRREGYRFVLDVIDAVAGDHERRGQVDDAAAEPRRVSVVWFVPSMAAPQLQPGATVPVLADPADDRLTWCGLDGVEPDRFDLVQALRDLDRP